ncbi:MAG TPA: HAMP domain-containing histidine kinase [Bacteroides mediterraneensis]|uniref:sensor histidine kinase n=1 Tax=Bacteroides mediterraneensis TaxID=1841856 RepID=UPI0026EC5612|nr:HAMP domain-containing sensor histidine kinase [Bacteroides mediterraneensis]HJH66473.1 HAMP domain-containing histidine kinase [Bacteroides mediterraneensis]
METSKRKKNILFITILSVVGLIGAMALQMIWIYNSYELIRNDILNEGYATIEKALEEEGNMRFGQTPKGTRIKSGPTNDTIPPMTYFYERLSDMGYPMSLHNLDSITAELLIQNGLGNHYYIDIINLRTGEKINGIGTQKEPSFMAVKPKYFPIRSDYTQVVQLIITNPNKTFLERMGLMLAGTFIIMLIVIVCISYQVRFISRFEKIFQIREDFSYAMIHDMKTPLTSIIMALNFLRSGKLDNRLEMKNKYFDIAENEADHLLTLTNKVLTISKLENHKLEMNKTEVELTPIIEKLTEKFKAKSQKTVNFITDIKAETAYADAEYLEEVLSNLIDNSIKYSGESVEIRISTARDDRYTVLKVHDNGFGISDKDIHLIFRKYERASAVKRNRRNGASGFGLGLNFVDQVVEAHHGKIFVSSIEGEFTEFTIYLPLAEDKNPMQNG